MWWLPFALAASWSALPSGTTRLPVVHIRTDSQELSEAGIVARLGISEDSDGVRFDDPWNAYQGMVDINWHGTSSSWFPKKSFAIELRDSVGKEVKASLLGMSAESEWILSAGFSDKSLIRNAFGYAMSAATGRYAPRTRMVELVVDSSYEGVYLLVERPMRDKDRVAVSKLESKDSAGDALTGGYILRVDRSGDGNGWFGAANPVIYYQHYYPKDSKITELQRTYIRDWMSSFEAAMESDGFAVPGEGYEKWIDTGSFRDHLLIQELSRNLDGYRLSSFLSKDKDSKGGKLQAGPIWDLDIAMGLADYYDGWKTDGWVYEWDARANDDGNAVPGWWPRLAHDQRFRKGLSCRWWNLRAGAWSDVAWRKKFDSLAKLAGSAQARNFQRWDILGERLWPEVYVPGTYAAEVDTLKRWLAGRFSWMDGQFPTGTCPPTPGVAAHRPGNAGGFIQRGERLIWERAPARVAMSRPDGERLTLDATNSVIDLAGLARGTWIVSWLDRSDGIWRARAVLR